MTFKLPDRAELQRLADELNQPLANDAADAMLAYMRAFEMGFQYLDGAQPDLPPVKYGPREYRMPDEEENDLGAWFVKSDIKGAPNGPLKNKRFAVKDNMLVAGLPMMNGTKFLTGVVPEFDATVVQRVLDAGATLVGKTTCEYLCLHGGSTTGTTGYVRNPHNPEYSAGGSSSGSAALVVRGEIDIAIGTDQAGSVRIPASWSGAVGMKPTHGLVPFTGIAGLEASIDHVGPITADVATNALMLEVIAGADPYDGRQKQPDIKPYTEALGQPIENLKIGVVREGFGHPQSSPAVDSAVRQGAETFSRLGAHVEDVSIPLHFPAGVAIWSGLMLEPVWHALRTGGVQFNLDTIYSQALTNAMHKFPWSADDIPVNIRMVMLFGKYMERFGGQYYAKARNLLPQLRKAYDQQLEKFDLLLLPTTVTQASRLPAATDNIDEHIITDLFGTSGNTCQFDATGHPAITIPCGMPNGLPVGLMLVGKHYAETTIYQAAHSFEAKLCD